MTITLSLPPELEHALSSEAFRLNLSLSEYILRILSKRQILENAPKTGAEPSVRGQNKVPFVNQLKYSNSQF